MQRGGDSGRLRSAGGGLRRPLRIAGLLWHDRNHPVAEDTVEFAWKNGTHWESLGERHRLYFRLDHFAGCRFALAVYATRESGGEAVFKDFVYQA